MRARSRATIVSEGQSISAVPQQRSYAVAGGLGAALLGVISYTFVYVPHYSLEAIENRERTGARKAASALAAARGDKAGIDENEGVSNTGPMASPVTVPKVDTAKTPFAAGLAKDNAPGSMWRSISAAREIRETSSSANRGEDRS